MSALRFDVITLFPELIDPFLRVSVLGSAVRDGRVEVRVTDLRDFAPDAHHVVDDAPYGGGDGMVLKCEPVVAAIESVRSDDARVVLLCPRGRRLDHARARELSELRHLVLVCGRYAGFDERIVAETGACVLSIGDYVLSGGEVAALAVIEAVTRLVPGVLGNPESADNDSFSGGLLEAPSYTRPREFRGRAVPEVLLSGDHAAVDRWRREQALRATRARRPDLLTATLLSSEDREILGELEHEGDSGHPD